MQFSTLDVSPFVAQATTGALRALLANARVPDMLAEHILGLGFQDIADFAFAYSVLSDLNTLLNEVPAEIWSALEVADHARSIPAGKHSKSPGPPHHSISQTSIARSKQGNPQEEQRTLQSSCHTRRRGSL